MDGTRCTVAPESILVECPGFASILSSHSEAKCTLCLPDSTVILCSSDGTYTVKERYGCHLDIFADGKAECKTGGGQYILCHTGENNALDAQDHTGNLIKVSVLGEASVDQKFSHTASTQRSFLPRFFVVDSGGMCAELLESECVASVLDAARQKPHNAVVQSRLPGEGDCSTIMVPVAVHQNPPYKESNIVPSGIRSEHVNINQNLADKHPVPRFGGSVGKGLMIGTYEDPEIHQAVTRPKLIEYSQFLHVNPVTATVRQDILSAALSFNEWSQGKNAKDVKSERKDNAVRQKVTGCLLGHELETDQAKLVPLYDKTFPQAQQTELPEDRPASCSRTTKIQAQYEFEEEGALKTALRQKSVPPYSISNLGSQSDAITQPNMEILTSKLASMPDTDSKQSGEPLGTFIRSSVSLTPSSGPVTLTSTSNQQSFPFEDDRQGQQECADRQAKVNMCLCTPTL